MDAWEVAAVHGHWKRVKTYPLTRGNFALSVRCFAVRSIFRSHAVTGVPGILVMEKFPSFQPSTSVHVGRVSPPPQPWYCSTYFFICFLLLCSAVLLHTPKTSPVQMAACATSLWKVEFDTS